MMVTRGVNFPIRIKFLLVFEYAILSAFSLIADDAKMNDAVIQLHHITTAVQGRMKEQIENISTMEGTRTSNLDFNLSNFDVPFISRGVDLTNRSTNLSSATFRNVNDSSISNQTDINNEAADGYNLGEFMTFGSRRITSTNRRSFKAPNEEKFLHSISHANYSVSVMNSSQNDTDQIEPLPQKLDREQFKDQTISRNANHYHLPLLAHVSDMKVNSTNETHQEGDTLVPITSKGSGELLRDFSALKNFPERLLENSTTESMKTISPIAKTKIDLSILSKSDTKSFIDKSKEVENLTGLESEKPVKNFSVGMENSVIMSNSQAKSDIQSGKSDSKNSLRASETQEESTLGPASSDSKIPLKVPNSYTENDLRSVGSNWTEGIKVFRAIKKGDDNFSRIAFASSNASNSNTAANDIDSVIRLERRQPNENKNENFPHQLKLAESPTFENGTFSNISHRRSKEFISEETLMESRNYNYDPAYPSYAQPVSPSGSGEEGFHPFATITREPGWYQDPIYPTLTTAKTPRAPQFPSNPHRWRLPLWYRARLRGYPKDEAFYDYLEDEELHRWSQPSAPASSVSPIRPEFHRYHEGGGYDYSPSYDFAHVHEHGGHTETTSKVDFSKIGLLLLLKLAIAKLKALGALQILLLLLLKAKLLLAMMALKFFMVLKAMKLLKYLIAPLLLSSLLPLLMMIPMSLLSALLPLIMNLTPMNPDEPEPPPDIPDVPDEPDTPDMPDMGGRRKKRKQHKSRGLGEIQRLLRSGDCLQRMACELAARRQLAIVPIIVGWSLKKLARMLPIPIVKAYAKAYSNGRQDQSSSGCSNKYKCNFLRTRSWNRDLKK